jgi:hypothetical protein
MNFRDASQFLAQAGFLWDAWPTFGRTRKSNVVEACRK